MFPLPLEKGIEIVFHNYKEMTSVWVAERGFKRLFSVTFLSLRDSDGILDLLQ